MQNLLGSIAFALLIGGQFSAAIVLSDFYADVASMVGPLADDGPLLGEGQ
jgi:hypothetical protein